MAEGKQYAYTPSATKSKPVGKWVSKNSGQNNQCMKEKERNMVQHQQTECVWMHQNPVGKSYCNALPIPKVQSFAVIESAYADAG